MSNISQKLDLRQTQNLVMTPQLQQAIEILQMSNVELTDFIEEELSKNPLLEKDNKDDSGASGDDNAASKDADSDTIDDAFSASWDEADGQERAKDNANKTEDFDAGSSMANVGPGGSQSFDVADERFENRMSHEISLRDHLQNQLHVRFADPRDRLIGIGLIDLLDDGGYLRESPDTLAERLGCSLERIESVLPHIKEFDPAGIGAQDLQECLAIQLRDQDLLDAPMEKLLANLDLVAKQEFKKLSTLCDVSETYLADMLGDIRALNPKPASLFDHVVVQTAIPDVLMKTLPKNLGGGWRVELNSDTLPKVLVNQQYYTEVAKATKDPKDKKYIDQQMQSASWLVRAMDQRAKTILKVASEIIEELEAFFLYGVEFLKPLTLKDIAKRIEMHESTVSRVTNNKYIGTPRGLFELKYFFTTALGEGANALSSESVKARIKTLIDEEDIKAVLSDEKIVGILNDEGVEIARRTVAKYREALKLGSSAQRKREKNNNPS